MNREIKFRGRVKHSNEWKYGSLLTYADGECNIITETGHRIDTWNVDPDTVGQYTGLKDVNKKEIYEDDNVEACFKYDDIGPNGGLIPDQDCIIHGIVAWEDCGLCIKLTDCEYPLKADFNSGDLEYMPFSAFESPQDDIEVIGNIHEQGKEVKK